MNEVFILGKIKTEIDFKFIVNSKKYFSKVNFMLQTLDKQEIRVKAYNEKADYVLKYLEKNDRIFIHGSLNTNMEIKIKELEKI